MKYQFILSEEVNLTDDVSAELSHFFQTQDSFHGVPARVHVTVALDDVLVGVTDCGVTDGWGR